MLLKERTSLPQEWAEFLLLFNTPVFRALALTLLLCLAGNTQSTTLRGETIPQPVPWLSELSCEAQNDILESAEIAAFGEPLVLASDETEPRLIDDIVTASAPQEAHIPIDNTWVMLQLLRERAGSRLPFTAHAVPRTITVPLEHKPGETVSFQVEGALMVTPDSGTATYDEPVLNLVRQNGKLITGLNLTASPIDGDYPCNGTDDYGHRSYELGLLYGSPNHALITAGQPLPFTHYEMKALNKDNVASWQSVIRGIVFAGAVKADSVTVSIGGFAGTRTTARLITAIEYAASQGTIVLAATGNRNEPQYAQFYPACLQEPNIVRVVALKYSPSGSTLWESSNTYCDQATGITVAFPGHLLLTKDQQGNPVYISGTSFANIYASFMVALGALDSQGQQRPLEEQLATFESRLRPPTAAELAVDRTGRDTFLRATFLRCFDFENGCAFGGLLPMISHK